MELIDGKIFGADEYRLVVLRVLPENIGADVAVRLGAPQVWREAITEL